MKESKLTTGSNLLWESSRMMLPEHVAALNQHKRESIKKVKPELDPQALEEIFYKLEEAYNTQSEIKVLVFDEYKDKEYIGIITNVDPQLKRIKIEHDDDFDWLPFEEILLVEIL